jgi:hypothetical protein
MKIHRYTRSEILEGNAGGADLPKSLSRLPFLAGRQAMIDRKRRWVLEVPAEVLERLTKHRVEATRARKRVKELSIVAKDLQNTLNEMAGKLQRVQLNNDRLMKNIAEDRRPDKFQRSPKHYLKIMEENNLKLTGLPLQGGLAGLEKK